MKLLSLEVRGPYKGIGNQYFEFSQCPDNIIALVGLNGTGKSQILELISEVFCYLERYQRRDYKVRTSLPFDITIEYECTFSMEHEEVGIYRLSIDEGLVVCHQLQGGHQIRIADVAIPLPSMTIGYSSSSNEGLQRSFLKNSMQHHEVIRARSNRKKRLLDAPANDIDKIIEINHFYLMRHKGVFHLPNPDDESFIDESDTPIPSCIFLDANTTSVLFASLLADEGFTFDELLPEITHPIVSKVILRYNLQDSLYSVDSISDIRQLISFAGEGKLTPLSSKLEDATYERFEIDYLKGEIEIDFTSEGVRKSFSETYYSDPRTLFSKLYKLQLLAIKQWPIDDKKNLLRDDFIESVKKPLRTKLPIEIIDIQLSNGESNVSIHDLSDGESQVMQSVAVAKVFNKRNALFLFDEPETHLNPQWRVNYHQRIKNHLSDASQTFVSTHSPFLISSLKKENVIQFEKTYEGITTRTPNLETYGSSFEILVERFFKLSSLISETAIKEINEKIETLEPDQAREWIEDTLGESMEKAYLLRKLM